jgi:hypothetical protein
LTITGTVTPPHPGQKVRLEEKRSSGWKVIESDELSSEGAYKLVTAPTTRGTKKYRVVKPADADHLGAKYVLDEIQVS